MRYLAAIALCLPLMAQAAPFLVTDPVDANGELCVLTMQGAAPQEFPVQTVGGQRICRIDVGPIFAVGPNVLTLAVAKNDAVFGRLASTAVPFSAVKPGPPPAPTNIRLVP